MLITTVIGYEVQNYSYAVLMGRLNQTFQVFTCAKDWIDSGEVLYVVTKIDHGAFINR